MSNAAPTFKVGLCGLGTVGQGVWRLFQDNGPAISRRAGAKVSITSLGVRSPKPHLETGKAQVCPDIMDVAKDPDVDILVEAIGGEKDAKTLVLEAISHGKHIVTANKALLALHGQEILAAARDQGVLVCFEAAVAGGIPIIKTIREGLLANQISAIRGIVNGTSNYILSAMTDTGQTMQVALEEAKEAGFAEEDPTFDIEGIDSAHKLAILASLAFEMPLAFDKIYTQGISHITSEDIQNAKEFGFCIKHLAIGRMRDNGYELRIHPSLVSLQSPLADASGALNAVELQADATGLTLYCGAGAGAKPTASAILADIADIIRSTKQGVLITKQPILFPPPSALDKPVLPVSEACAQHYVRLNIQDQPGALHQITAKLSEAQIGIEKVRQSDASELLDSAKWKSLVIITHEAREAAIQSALQGIRAMPTVDKLVQHIRIDNGNSS